MFHYNQPEPLEDWSKPDKEPKQEAATRNAGGSNDSRTSSSNTIDDTINDEDAEIQSVVDVSRFIN